MKKETSPSQFAFQTTTLRYEDPALVLGLAENATEVPADLREPLGGADKLAAVRTLAAVGIERRAGMRL